MSKPSELVFEIGSGIGYLRTIAKERLDGELLDKVEQQLRDAERLVWEAVDAVKAAIEEAGALDRSG